MAQHAAVSTPEPKLERTRYCSAIYSLIGCPSLTKDSWYALAKRDADGNWTVVETGIASEDFPPLNLATVRQRGALLGASAVCVVAAGQSQTVPKTTNVIPMTRSRICDAH